MLRRDFFVLRANQTCLSLWERCRAATERAGSLVRELDCRFAARLREFCQIDKIRMRFALIRTCSCAAPSVTACAAPPSSERKAFVSHNLTCLSLWERCRAATERAGSLVRELDLPQAKTEGVLQIGKIRMRFALIRTRQRAALSVICFANASSPKGRAKKPVRAVHLTNQKNSHTDLLACCSFRHGLRRATFLREEGFCFAQSNLSLPLGEMSRSDREGCVEIK